MRLPASVIATATIGTFDRRGTSRSDFPRWSTAAARPLFAALGFVQVDAREPVIDARKPVLEFVAFATLSAGWARKSMSPDRRADPRRAFSVVRLIIATMALFAVGSRHPAIATDRAMAPSPPGCFALHLGPWSHTGLNIADPPTELRLLEEKLPGFQPGNKIVPIDAGGVRHSSRVPDEQPGTDRRPPRPLPSMYWQQRSATSLQLSFTNLFEWIAIDLERHEASWEGTARQDADRSMENPPTAAATLKPIACP